MFSPGQIFAFVIAVVGLVLTVLNIYDKLTNIKRTASAPMKELESRVNVLEVKAKEFEEKLLKGNDMFRDHDHAFEVMIKSLMALIEFEMEYCTTEHKTVSKGLEKAKEELHDYLASR